MRLLLISVKVFEKISPSKAEKLGVSGRSLLTMIFPIFANLPELME